MVVSGTKLQFTFASENLRELCEKRAAASEAFGDVLTRELSAHLADMDAASAVSDLFELFGAQLINVPPHSLRLTLISGLSVDFCAAHVKVPMDTQGVTDWTKVTRIKVMNIESANAG